MNCHQVLSGACNSGDQCFAVGSVEGIPFTAYAAGCNIVILASNFERVQIIPGAIHSYVRIGSLDCSTDTGKIAASYGAEVCIFEPTPLIHTSATTHGLEYRWVQTGKLVADGPITALSWNLEGTRLLTGGKLLQLWHQASLYQDDSQPSSGVTFQIGGDKEDKPKQAEEDEPGWICVWQCHTATPAHHLAFSPDGVLFATSGINDRLVKIWYQNKVLAQAHNDHSPPELNYTFIYVAHPRAVTHLSWRKTSKYMPKGSVGNVLVTSCVDNICRVWAETLLPEDEWGGGCVTSHSRSPPRRQRATHRHKHRFMQRLKHMKTCFHIRRTAQSSKQPGAPIPTLPSTYSAHDFHNPYHATSYTGGLHFHLAASINAETDIPLVPSLAGGGRFILHWLHNKEMHFTSQAEAILHDLTKKILDKEETDEGGSGSDHTAHPDGEHESSGNHSHPTLSNTTSINSIATDVTCTHLPDSLDAKIESLLRDWHQSPDLLFSIHPVDGSFLIWVCEWLDELQAGAIRQAQVSFSARIPSAFPLGDATTMCTPAALYHAAAQPLYVRHRTKPVMPMGPQPPEQVTTPLASVQEEKEENEWPQGEGDHHENKENGNREENNNEMHRKTSVATEDLGDNPEGDVLDSAPVISMVTNHTNGTLNLWQLTFDDKSKFSQVLSIGHASRASGHRFRVNDITCHPVLPLLLTTSHHNISDSEREHHKYESDAAAGGLCSELIMWRVECVGPLGKSGGVAELARVNSPHLSAFSNVAWLPTLLPSTTLGNLSNSPSACFVASDGESLRVFQAVIDARTLLAEIATSERRHKDVMHDTMSMSSESTLEEGGGVPLHERIQIVSQQSTARPGAIIQLHAIADATHDWHNTQLLHVFQEQLITGERTSVDSENADSGLENSEVNTLTEAGLEAIVDLRKAATFNEPFYIVVLERTDGGSTVHMWRLTVSSQADPSDDLTNSMMYVPDSALIQEDEGESRKNSVSMDNDRAPPQPLAQSHISISTKKVCECPLSLPDGVDVIHATPAAGHLSSASIYPACLAPYIMATACSDSTLRFWKCQVTKTENEDIDYTWIEWEMMNKDQESAIDIPGQPLHISAAYSGRIACAYKCGRSFTRPKGGTTTNNTNPDARFVNLCVCVYECESTGGAEWLLEDTIPLRNVSLPRVGVCTDTQIDLSYLHDTSFMQKKQRLNQVLQTLSSDESRNNRNGEGDTGKSAGLLAVPSFSTLQSLRKSIMENGNTCPLTQKHLVQLDWVSKEDGSHILTVAVGSRVLLFTPVSSDLAQANLKAMKESISNNRPLLRKASSLAAPLFVEEIRWMQLRRIELKTADGLPPLPMQISWVRDGILVVGMDSEMHVYSQWKPENPQTSSGYMGTQELEEGSESRALRDSDLRISAPHLQRVSSINLQLLERDARRRNKTQPDQPQPLLDYMPDYGLFEASQMACPVLPQYHPKQLMELLNSGKIRWVKAILAHLVRCIGGTYTVRSSQGDEDSLSRQRGWSRSRTLSVSFAAGAASPLDGIAQITEDVQLDYAEITSVPPLPLWTLLVADKESPHHPSTIQEAKDYNELFEGTIQDTEEDLDALLLGDEERVDRRPSMPERQPLSHFGLRQGRILSRLLTHTHLPGLSSIDQMHLLALADTVSTCDADFAERLATNARVDVTQATGQEVLPDSLDDCGLRFLLAMKHYGYLLRCLPLAQRASLQRTGVGTCNLVWAFHSETHEQLLALIPGYTKGTPKWSTMRELGVGWWVRGELLRTCIEKLARASYMQKQDPMDAALYYLAMKKRMLLWGLFRSSRDEKMTKFFSNDFTEDRWRKAALKNAFVLLGRQRFEHAAAFFLLGGALKDALEVLITRLGDLQLAMVVARLYESENPLPASLKKLLMDEILGGETEDGELDLERAHPDPFVRSMALWKLKRYGDALNTLISNAGRLHAAKDNEPMPSVFNFYVYLRTHPRLKRHNMPSQGGTLALLQQEPEEGITRLERRLYFQTAHGHFKAGCPALALEVLSKLPARVRDERPKQAPVPAPSMADAVIHSGQLVDQPVKNEEPTNVDWGAPAVDVDWGAPVAAIKKDELVLSWDDGDGDKGSDDSGASTPPLEMKMDKKEEKEEPIVNGNCEKEAEEPPSVDIMAQQLKFTACLKILMEELSTLATGFEVDGGHLRYQLYIWLEREVEALRRLCGYLAAGGDGGGALLCAEPELAPLPDRPTLHQLLVREKADFEAKVQRALNRKKWLKANETLLRTLLSYCSLHGAGGGGLASVRMELVLLLQELGQDKQHQQLLSPLPFPTTLPLLAAAVATNNTVVADPVRHLQSVAHDMLGTIGELGIPGGSATRILHTLRELAVALSACIYQSLCDSDTFSLKHAHHHDCVINDTSGTSHTITRQRRHSTDDLTVTTPPNKWPGVSALRGLALRAAEEEDAPRLAVLLAEAFCGVYLALLGWAAAARDAHLLYRLCAHAPAAPDHARLFGGGVRRLLTTAPAPSLQPKLVERPEGTSVWSSLREKRALLNMRLLGLGPTVPHKNIQEGRPTYREQFVPPHCSILTYLLTKPTAEQDPENYDYDSAESGGEDIDEEETEVEDDDIFDTATANRIEKHRKLANSEHSNPDSYSWLVMRIAVLRLAQQKLQNFLQLCGIEMSELATTSPMVHGALRRVDQWQQQLTETLESRAPPQDYIPGCFPEQLPTGPPINKYRCLLEKHNTPFSSVLFSAAPARRLWSFLVRQEPVQDLFIRAVFSRRRTQSVTAETMAAEGRGGCIPQSQRERDLELHNPVRIIHKEQDSIAAFCLNKVGGCLLAVATAREVQEMDVSLLLRAGAWWAEDECELDLLALAADPAALPDTGFLLIQHHDKPNSGSVPGTGNSSPLNPNAPQVPVGMASQTGRGASVVLKHKIDNIKRMAAHPSQPLYLTGGADGSVQLWEWGHPSCVWSPRAPGAFAKVTRVRFSDYGNKFAASDADGNLAMWQLHPAPHQAGHPHASPRPFFTHQCHSKGISDFVFLGSCSLVATAGHSSESKNVAIWDTLMPTKKALVVSWTCHEGGAACVVWAGSLGALVSCGRRGDVLVWDLRSRAVRHRLHAHHAPIKCVALSPREDYYAIGAADGDIKVFSLTTHQLLYTFAGEHARSSFFKHIGQGVTQIHIDNAGRLFSCGADGTMKVRKLPERDSPLPHQPQY